VEVGLVHWENSFPHTKTLDSGMYRDPASL